MTELVTVWSGGEGLSGYMGHSSLHSTVKRRQPILAYGDQQGFSDKTQRVLDRHAIKQDYLLLGPSRTAAKHHCHWRTVVRIVNEE